MVRPGRSDQLLQFSCSIKIRKYPDSYQEMTHEVSGQAQQAMPQAIQSGSHYSYITFKSILLPFKFFITTYTLSFIFSVCEGYSFPLTKTLSLFTLAGSKIRAVQFSKFPCARNTISFCAALCAY